MWIGVACEELDGKLHEMNGDSAAKCCRKGPGARDEAQWPFVAQRELLARLAFFHCFQKLTDRTKRNQRHIVPQRQGIGLYQNDIVDLYKYT